MRYNRNFADLEIAFISVPSCHIVPPRVLSLLPSKRLRNVAYCSRQAKVVGLSLNLEPWTIEIDVDGSPSDEALSKGPTSDSARRAAEHQEDIQISKDSTTAIK
jgi:hypothetical protein